MYVGISAIRVHGYAKRPLRSEERCQVAYDGLKFFGRLSEVAHKSRPLALL